VKKYLLKTPEEPLFLRRRETNIAQIYLKENDNTFISDKVVASKIERQL
jgi:hypothetical protein